MISFNNKNWNVLDSCSKTNEAQRHSTHMLCGNNNHRLRILGTKTFGILACGENALENLACVFDHPKVPLSTIVVDNSYENTSKVESQHVRKLLKGTNGILLCIGNCSEKLKHELKEL